MDEVIEKEISESSEDTEDKIERQNTAQKQLGLAIRNITRRLTNAKKAEMP